MVQFIQLPVNEEFKPNAVENLIQRNIVTIGNHCHCHVRLVLNLSIREDWPKYWHIIAITGEGEIWNPCIINVITSTVLSKEKNIWKKISLLSNSIEYCSVWSMAYGGFHDIYSRSFNKLLKFVKTSWMHPYFKLFDSLNLNGCIKIICCVCFFF